MLPLAVFRLISIDPLEFEDVADGKELRRVAPALFALDANN